MSSNLLETMMKSYGNDFAAQASKFLGASEDMTKAGMGAVFPSLLGGVMQQGSTPAGAASLMNALNSPSIGTDLAGSMAKMFGSGQSANDFMTLGTNLVKGLFGDRFADVAKAAASTSGLASGAIEKMFAMGAPLLFGFLKNQIAAGKLDTDGVMKLLDSQRDFVKSGIDTNLAGLLGLSGSVGGFFAGVTGALSKAFGAATEAGTTAIEEATKMAEKVAGVTADTARAAGEVCHEGGRGRIGSERQCLFQRGEDSRDPRRTHRRGGKVRRRDGDQGRKHRFRGQRKRHEDSGVDGEHGHQRYPRKRGGNREGCDHGGRCGDERGRERRQGSGRSRRCQRGRGQGNRGKGLESRLRSRGCGQEENLIPRPSSPGAA